MADVEGLRVEAVETLDSSREPLLGRFDHEVIVGAHQAEGVAAPLEAVDRGYEQGEEIAAVLIVAEDPSMSDSVGGHVVEAVREVAT